MRVACRGEHKTYGEVDGATDTDNIMIKVGSSWEENRTR